MRAKLPDYKRLFERFITSEEADGEWRAFCPLHEDPNRSKTPSASFNFEKGVWNCQGCDGGGSIRRLVAMLRGKRQGRSIKPVKKVAAKKQTSSNSEAKQPKKALPSELTVQGWSDKLFSDRRRLEFMTEERGLTKHTLRTYQVGWDGFRYTFPIRDADGGLVNVRRYDPKRKDKNKMISWGEGHGKARIYGIELLMDKNIQEVLFVEGELDRLVACQMGFNAITHTAGAMTFMAEWGKLCKGKDVFFCYDSDDTGRKGMARAAKFVVPHANGVYLCDMDIDIKGGDITDFFITQGRSKDEFLAMMEAAREKPFGSREVRPPAVTTGIAVSLEESQSVEYGDKAIEVVVSISGKQSPPYLAPRRIKASCEQDKGQVCSICPVGHSHGKMTHTLQPDDPMILEFIDINNKLKRNVYREVMDAKCNDRVKYDVEEFWTVEQLIATNSVEHRTEETQTPTPRPVMNVGTYKTPINITARLVGRQMTDPKSQRGLLHSWVLEQTQTNLDLFKVNKDTIERLRIFRPRRGQSPLDRIKHIAEDLSANVTHIYGRPELHIGYDLVWHSVLDFNFQGKRIGKGWLEMLVVGDTRTGKSDAATQLARHYQAGIVKSCEGMTFAGLVGGAHQIGGRHWSVNWGVIPLNDRRLVVLDEVSGIKDKDIMENMSSIRSSGRAQITKIVQDEASARTRLIWISNPPDGRALREINGGGMEVVSSLVRNPEDIARFDFAMAAAAGDVDADLINRTVLEDVQHKFTEELCSELVMWAWSRTADQVYWVEGSEDSVVAAAKEFGKRYVPDPPLVQIENVRIKIARIAVAIAARTFSSDSSGELVIVKQSHVDDAIKFLDMIYGMESFGYLRHSRRVVNASNTAVKNAHEAKEYLEEHSEDIRHTLLSIGGNMFKTRDFEEIGAMDRLEAQIAVRQLLEWKMIRRLSRGLMRMEPALIELLREWEDKEET